jgi:regulatory protein
VKSEVPDKQVTVVGARAFAYRYLGLREHSEKELYDKLSRKGIADAVIAQAIAELADEGLVSNERFADAFTRSRLSRKVGPLKIRAELMKRGIKSNLIDHTLEEYQGAFPEAAFDWVSKRHRGELDRKEKARLYRSGTSRGFSHEHMMNAIDQLQEPGFKNTD